MKKKIIALICAIACMTALTTGCGGSEEAATEAPTAIEEAATEEAAETTEAKKIGLAMPIADGEFLKGLIEQVEAKAKERGYEISTTSADGVVAKQIEQIENFISMGVDIIIAMPTDDSSLNDVMRKSKDAGIMTIAMGCNPSDTECYTYCVNTDKYQQGQSATQTCADYIDATWPDAEDGSIEVCILANSAPGDSKRLSDALFELESLTSKAKVVVSYDLQNEQNPTAKTQEYISMMSLQYPEVKVILSYCDTYALAANELLMQNTEINKETFGIICADKSDASVQLLKDSESGNSLIRGVGDIGEDLATPLFDVIEEKVEFDEYNRFIVNTVPVTLENVDDYLK